MSAKERRLAIFVHADLRDLRRDVIHESEREVGDRMNPQNRLALAVGFADEADHVADDFVDDFAFRRNLRHHEIERVAHGHAIDLQRHLGRLEIALDACVHNKVQPARRSQIVHDFRKRSVVEGKIDHRRAHRAQHRLLLGGQRATGGRAVLRGAQARDLVPKRLRGSTQDGGLRHLGALDVHLPASERVF